jgi:heme/copper-type cytochrome/quinol oxidase subunit 1
MFNWKRLGKIHFWLLFGFRQSSLVQHWLGVMGTLFFAEVCELPAAG